MTASIRSAFLAAALAGAMLFASAPALAVTFTCTETAAGAVCDLLAESGFPGFVTVASDGESSFDPFGFGADTSDGIQFTLFDNGPWIQAADSQWTQIAGGVGTWVLPAISAGGPGCPGENAIDTSGCFELVGHWIQIAGPGFPLPQWAPGLPGEYDILSADGTVADKITLFNTANGAELIFQSDPIPEPATMALVGISLLGLGAFRRRRA